MNIRLRNIDPIYQHKDWLQAWGYLSAQLAAIRATSRPVSVCDRWYGRWGRWGYDPLWGYAVLQEAVDATGVELLEHSNDEHSAA